MTDRVRDCGWCGVQFRLKDQRNRFCGIKCSALATGRKRYGDPALKKCSKCDGAVEPTYARYGRICKACRFVRAKRHRDLRPELHRAAVRRHAKKHPDARRMSGWRAQGIDMTIERFDELLKEQGGRCAICRTASPGKRQTWHVDHDHDFGHTRGLLCHFCNKSLGGFRDSPGLLRAALRYLLKHQPQLKLKAS